MTQNAPSRLAPALPPRIIKPEDPVAVDFETFYSSEFSVSDASYWHYTHDPRFRAYLVSIVCDEFEWVGDPKNFDWSRIDGRLWLSHNRAFDGAVYARLVEIGIVAPIARTFETGVVCESTGARECFDERASPQPAYWADTAALSVYLRAPRNLKGAMQALFGVTRDKAIRDRDMKGKQWEEYGPDLQQKILAYAIDDGRDCRRIWVEHSWRWPEKERRIADLLETRGTVGMAVDQEGIAADIRTIEQIKFEAEQKIPWRHESPILSPKAVREECRKNGIEPPASFAMGDEECAEWELQHGEKFPWVAAVRDWRRANALLEKFKAMRARIMPDGRMAFSLLYMGAHTGRTSGSGGFNMLNLARQPFYYTTNWNLVHRKEQLTEISDHLRSQKKLPEWVRGGIDMRSKFIAGPGKKFVIGDKAQIEARITRWLARDRESLRLIEEGFTPYEVHARRFMGWTGGNMKKEDPAGYQLAKARELALGFAVGWHKFITMARSYVDDVYFLRIFGAETTPHARGAFCEYIESLRNKPTKLTYRRMWANADELTKNIYVNSWLQVSDYRRKNPEIVGLWDRLGDEIKRSIGENYEIVLPSGRSLTYFNVTDMGDGVQARTERGGPFKYFHGGLLTENIVQATARDVFIESQLRVADAGIPIVLDVYDELVTEPDEQFDPSMLKQLMEVRPPWARDLPIEAEVECSTFYKK